MYQLRIKPDGLWHRRQVGGDEELTACGEPLSGAVMSRDWELDDNLCEICFTKAERRTGRFKKLEREIASRDPRELYDERYGYDDDEQTTDPDADGIAERTGGEDPVE